MTLEMKDTPFVIPTTAQFRALFEEVSSEILRVYEGVDPGTVYKKDNSPQTEADRLSSLRITKFLETNTPYPVLSEESEEEKDLGEIFWTLDPLDGTADFLKKTDEFSIMVSLVKGDTPIFGIIYQPVTRICYVAKLGKGAFLIEADGSPHQLHVTNISETSKIRMVVSRSHAQPADLKITEALGITERLPHGSFGLKAGLIAQGEAELLWYPPKVTAIWDSAPSMVLLAEAEGKITDLDGNPLLIQSNRYRNERGIVATNGKNHTHIVNTIRKIIE